MFQLSHFPNTPLLYAKRCRLFKLYTWHAVEDNRWTACRCPLQIKGCAEEREREWSHRTASSGSARWTVPPSPRQAPWVSLVLPPSLLLRTIHLSPSILVPISHITPSWSKARFVVGHTVMTDLPLPLPPVPTPHPFTTPATHQECEGPELFPAFKLKVSMGQFHGDKKERCLGPRRTTCYSQQSL